MVQRTYLGLTGLQWRIVIAAWLGWLMDGYVTIAYALAASIIAPLFFPAFSKLAALIATYLAFTLNGLARPLGGLLFGNYIGDKLGRRTMLVLTILGFSLIGFSRGFLPTYKQVGVIAPITLFILLFFEGMFAGAEYGGGTALSMESIPPDKRGAIGSFVQSGFGTGYFIVSFVFAGLASYFGPAMSTIGWRVLFWTSIVIGLLAFIMRYTIPESMIFEDMKIKKEIEKIPLKSLIKEAYMPLITGLLITTGLLSINGITFSLYPTIIAVYDKLGETLMGILVGIINLISLFGVWFGGILVSLLIQRRKFSMLIYSLIFLILIYPTVMLVLTPLPNAVLLGGGLQAFIEAMIFAPLPALLSEIFSKRYRTTGVGFTYNGGLIVGSWAIPITLALSGIYGFRDAWLLTLFLWNIVLIIGILLARETWGKEDLIVK
jgi:MFS family permease